MKRTVYNAPETQIAIIKQHLIAGDEITPLRAFDLCRTIRLSAIIFELRHKHGMAIENLGGHTGHAIYRLVKAAA